MDRSNTPGPGGAARAEGDDAEAPPRNAPIHLEAIEFRSSHGLLRACENDVGWKNEGELCPVPEWTPARHHPVSHTLGEKVELAVTLEGAESEEPLTLLGVGPAEMRFTSSAPSVNHGAIEVRSGRPIARRIAKVSLAVDWSVSSGAALSPERTENLVYTTMGQPLDDRQDDWPEDGVTLRRMDRSVAWVAPLRSLSPHHIVRALIEKFPFYALHPSPKVPRKYHHPTYFNDEGGAWPMSDYVSESGECQAIVRLVRAMLRQLGVPGQARTVLVWGDPDKDGGRTAISAYWDEHPDAGLDRTKMVHGRRWLAALVDAPVEVGKVYPASHTPQRDGPSPGLNRFEAALEFTYGGVTRDYGGGAGVFNNREEVLRGFWGLVWVSSATHDGFRVEEIVTTY